MKAINQNQITNFNRSPSDLLLFLLWTTTVAGKRSDVQTAKFNRLFKNRDLTTLDLHGNALRKIMKTVGLGQYDRLSKCWKSIRNTFKNGGQLYTINRNELTNIPGIGPKTASFFIAHSREYAEVAVLDTHVLKWLKLEWPNAEIPDTTPQDENYYQDLEALFLGRSCQLDMSPSELDTAIWQAYANNKPEQAPRYHNYHA